MIPSDKEIDEGIRRLALTADGLLLYRYLQKELTSLPASTESGALHEHTGGRRFAGKLKALMDQELAKVGIKRDTGGRHDPDELAIVKPAEPVSSGDRRSRRRVEPYSDKA